MSFIHDIIMPPKTDYVKKVLIAKKGSQKSKELHEQYSDLVTNASSFEHIELSNYKKFKRLRIATLIIILLVIGFIGSLVPTQKDVPNVVGKSCKVAVKEMGESYFKAECTDPTSDKYTITSQSLTGSQKTYSSKDKWTVVVLTDDHEEVDAKAAEEAKKAEQAKNECEAQQYHIWKLGACVDNTEIELKKQAEEELKKMPVEYKNALRKAEDYLEFGHFSYDGLYEQLTSEYGEKFSAEASRWAVDNCGADWNQQALKAAKSYQDTMHMSSEGIREQLMSSYGEGFTREQADYAIAHLND